MSHISQIQSQLADAYALIAEWESHLAAPGAPPSIRVNVESLRRRCEELERELVETASRLGSELCRYRLFDESKRQPRAAAIGAALQTFQIALTTIYDAQTDRPKERARASIETVDKTALEFGYAFAGSAGFVFTVDGERLLFDNLATELEAAVDTLFEIAAATSPSEIGKYVPKVGHGGIRAVQAWVKSHASAGLGADIKWVRNRRVSASCFKQFKEWVALEKAIEETGDEIIEEVLVVGELWAVDLKTHRFMMRFEGADDLRGTFSDAISETHHAELPKRYRATLEKTTRIHYSLQENEVSYFLKHLEAV